jgi:ubiquinone biosynthesis protein UbiJ
MADTKVFALKQSLIPKEIREAWALMDDEAKFAWFYNELAALQVQIDELQERVNSLEEGD